MRAATQQTSSDPDKSLFVSFENFELCRRARCEAQVKVLAHRLTRERFNTAWAEKRKEYDLPADIREKIQAHMDDIEISQKDSE